MNGDVGSRPTPLTAVVTTDLAGITRGRFVAAPRSGEHLSGVGWVPANLALNAFGEIFPDNPWGSAGDLRLLPDVAARFRSESTGAQTPFDIAIGDLKNMDGSPWVGCTRSLLGEVEREFRARSGLRLVASFEHEFVVLGGDPSAEHCFSIGALRRRDPFGPRLMTALSETGVEPEVVLAEYGPDQFEVTCAPTDALRAADRAVVVRELTREVCRNLGWRASFAPKLTPDGVGTGVHIHFSFRDGANRPVTYDPGRPAGLSAQAGSFCAGVLRHLPALVALTAPSIPSFYRLQPHHWSSAWTWLAERDREATLRICPGFGAAGGDLSNQYNIEYRAADSIANPYMALAALLQAGLAGIEEKLEAAIVADDPATLNDAARDQRGLHRLPETFEDALSALERDRVLTNRLDPRLLKTYFGIKRAEIHAMRDLDRSAICSRYATRY